MDSEVNEEPGGSWSYSGSCHLEEAFGETFGDQRHSLASSWKMFWGRLLETLSLTPSMGWPLVLPLYVSLFSMLV